MTTTANNLSARIEALKAEYDDDLIWGIRWDVAGLEAGHIFDASRVWEDGEPTDETLNGTSAIQETHLSRISGIYPGVAYLVAGYHAGYGEDSGEVILSECEVMEIV